MNSLLHVMVVFLHLQLVHPSSHPIFHVSPKVTYKQFLLTYDLDIYLGLSIIFTMTFPPIIIGLKLFSLTLWKEGKLCSVFD